MQYVCVTCVNVIFMSEATANHASAFATATAAVAALRVAVAFAHVDSAAQFIFLPFSVITIAPLFIYV